MQNSQTTRKVQHQKSKITAQSFDALMAKGLTRRTAAEEALYGCDALMAEARDADAWWPAQSRAILEDARRYDRIRRDAEADLMADLEDWQREARKAKRNKPKLHRAALLALETRGAAQ